MIRGLYSAAGGMNATAIQQDATAHNISHAMKPGYLREVVRFTAPGPASEMVGPNPTMHTDFTPGTMQYTGGKLDLALEGPGFFAVQGPSGPMYTRSGTFQINDQGRLMTMEGFPAMGTGGPIDIPLGTFSLEVLSNGAIIADGIEVDQVKVVGFQDLNQLQRIGTSYFSAPTDAPKAQVVGEVFQGYREISNSTLVQEMVQMVAGVRQFEAAQRALRSIGDAIAFNTRPLNR